MRKKILIGVAWPYVNGDLHIGHLAGYLLPADIFARFNRFIGNDVLMVSGSDCFGTPITIEADKKKVHPKEIIDEYHEKDVNLFKYVGISFDLYTKTDTENHKKVTQDIFIAMAKKGLIFKDTSLQYFSKKEERFLPDRYVEGTCPNCKYESARSDQCEKCGTILDQGELINPKSKNSGDAVTLKKTEHYFIDWPKLEPFLKKYVESKKNIWRDWVYKETCGWLEKGLRPRATTRDLDWGIEIPKNGIPENLKLKNSSHKRIYVWFDAVIGYLSASIEWSGDKDTWKEFWYNKDAMHYYFMGKDNLIFHALFWPGQLHGYDENIHLPDFQAINQYLNLEGQKFSKSRGITVDSLYITETYGVDPVRFYLTTIAPENHDTNFSWSDFVRTTNDILIGNFGNFINRTLTLAKNARLDKKLVDNHIEVETNKLIENAIIAINKCMFKKYVEIMLEIADRGNKYLSHEEPWLFVEKNHKFDKIISNSSYILLALHALMKPIIPNSYDKLSNMINVDFKNSPDNEEIKNSIEKIRLNAINPLFKKIDASIIEMEKEKISKPLQ